MTQDMEATVADKRIPMAPFPFGAVYFRKTNPPRAEWERDYGVCAADGLNTFRHWVLWGSIELAPGVGHDEVVARTGAPLTDGRLPVPD